MPIATTRPVGLVTQHDADTRPPPIIGAGAARALASELSNRTGQRGQRNCPHPRHKASGGDACGKLIAFTAGGVPSPMLAT